MRTDLTTFEKIILEHNVDIHSVMVISDNKILLEKYYQGQDSIHYSADTLHPMYSITKSFVSIAIGLLCKENKLALDTPVIQYFPEYEKYADINIKMTTIENLLSMKTCHTKTTYKIEPENNWIESFFITPSDKKPGTSFDYDTSGTHVLCAIIQKLTGLSLLEYLNSRIDKLNISNEAYIKLDPFGAEIGGAGLMCTPRDLIGFASFIYNSIKHPTPLLSEDYLAKATSSRSSTIEKANLPFKKYGYGYYFWIQPKNNFMCYGKNGQFIYFCNSGFVITTADTSADSKLDQTIIDAIEKAFI